MKWIILAIVFLIGCNQHSESDGVKSNENKQLYTCSMHPEIVKDKPGDCPICGMKLVKKESDTNSSLDGKGAEVELSSLLKPANQYVVSSIPVTTMKAGNAQNEMEALGVTDYDTRMIGNISAKVSGRIQNLYVKYTFQEVMQGDKIMEIYSPELLTAEQDLLFLVKNDPSNISLINSAKQKLLLMGVSSSQLGQILNTGKTSYTISVYSSYSGHIHDMGSDMTSPETTNDLITKQLKIKEGMYVQKGQTVFSVYNPHRLAALIDVYPEQQPFIKTGTTVRITPESFPDKYFTAKIDFIEPFFREGSKTLKARVYFDNSRLDIPVGSQVKATIFGKNHTGDFLPKEAVVSLGKNKIVFLKTQNEFQTHIVQTGISYNDEIEIINGLSEKDSVAANAQYLMDAESLIKTK
jgi:Cu(I)/Ag(I) efflux system membrane fusion protein